MKPAPYGVFFRHLENDMGDLEGIATSLTSGARGGTIQRFGRQQYFLRRVFPDLFSRDTMLNAPKFVLGSRLPRSMIGRTAFVLTTRS